LKFWKIGFLLTHTFTLGLLGPVVGIPLAIKMKRLPLSIFMLTNLVAVWIFWSGIVSTPDGGTLPTFPTVTFLVNYIGGFFLPLFIRAGKKDSVPDQT
jgi:uncharacterized membrane protein YphA (DoxX/SURF4 family)